MAVVSERRLTRDRRKDLRRRIAVEVAISLAEMNAGWGDFSRALEHLAAADQLAGGAVAHRFQHLRASWVEDAAVGT